MYPFAWSTSYNPLLSVRCQGYKDGHGPETIHFLCNSTQVCCRFKAVHYCRSCPVCNNQSRGTSPDNSPARSVEMESLCFPVRSWNDVCRRCCPTKFLLYQQREKNIYLGWCWWKNGVFLWKDRLRDGGAMVRQFWVPLLRKDQGHSRQSKNIVFKLEVKKSGVVEKVIFTTKDTKVKPWLLFLYDLCVFLCDLCGYWILTLSTPDLFRSPDL